MKKIYIYEVEPVLIGDQSPIFTDSASEALAVFKSFKSAGILCRLYRQGKLIMYCVHKVSYET